MNKKYIVFGMFLLAFIIFFVSFAEVRDLKNGLNNSHPFEGKAEMLDQKLFWEISFLGACVLQAIGVMMLGFDLNSKSS